MKKLYDAADRFCARHPRFGIPDLMRWIVIGNVVVYVLMLLADFSAKLRQIVDTKAKQ